MSIFTDWSLLSAFVIKGTISCFVIAIAGYALAHIKPFKDDEEI